MAASSSMECGDVLEFQDSLRKMREIDDKIIYMLNTTIPTDSFKGQVDAKSSCKDLFQQIQSVHSRREISIKNCLNTTREKMNELKEAKSKNPDDISISKDLRKVQNNLRMLESELSIEEVVKNRTSKIYNEKCRSFYKPSKQDL